MKLLPALAVLGSAFLLAGCPEPLCHLNPATECEVKDRSTICPENEPPAHYRVACPEGYPADTVCIRYECPSDPSISGLYINPDWWNRF